MGENGPPGVKNHCWCGIHPHTVTKVIAWLSIIVSAVGIVGSLVSFIALKPAAHKTDASTVDNTSSAISLSGIVVAILQIIIGALLLFGVYKKRQVFYFPFLLLSVINTVGGIIIFILLFAIHFLSLFATKENKLVDPVYEAGFLAGNAIGFVISCLAFYLCVVVVERSRKIVQWEAAQNNSSFSKNQIQP